MRFFDSHMTQLFSGLNNNSPMSSFSFMDYAAIKNGSYGKLLKAHYAEQAKAGVDSDTTSKVKTDRSKAKVDDTGLSALKKEADSLKTSISKIGSDDLWKTTDGKYDSEKIAGAVKDFVKDYNDVLTKASKVNSKAVGRSIDSMESMTDMMSKALSKIGITVETDGKLSVNDEALKNANPGSVKSLFAGVVSYGSQISDRAGEISRDAVMNSSTYNSNASLTINLFGTFDSTV